MAMKKNYNVKKTISIKQFISEFGENLSAHAKDRLLDLEVRSVLTRKTFINIVDIKHVEHTLFDFKSEDGMTTTKKEYTFGQLIAKDGQLYFSESCMQGDEIIASPIVHEIYNKLSSDDIISEEDCCGKKINDDNIDYIIDSILSVCPEVSQRYLDIVSGMTSRADNKTKNVPFFKTYK
jgi:hypothetical protein